MDMEDIIFSGEDDSVIRELADINDSVDSNVLLEDSFPSCLNAATTSTPRKQPTKTSSSLPPTKPRLNCPECNKTYANERTLGVHQKMHTMKGISSRLPSLGDLKSLVREAFVSTLEEIQKEGIDSDIGIYCGELVMIVGSGGDRVTEFLNCTFHNILRSQNALLPSALRSAIFCSHNKLMNNDSFCKEFSTLLFDLKEASPEILNFVSGYGTYKSFLKNLLAVLKLLQGKTLDCSKDPDRMKRSNDRLESVNFWQLTYHIGGSIINGILYQAKKFDQSETWTTYADVLNAKFLRQPFAPNECSAEVRSFTEQKERWAHKHCNQEAFDFFKILFDALMSLEESDGSLLTSVAEDHVFHNDQLIFLWDDLVGCELEEDYSLNLLSVIVRKAADTVRKGILKRRLSEELQKAYSSVALRPRLAR